MTSRGEKSIANMLQ